MYRKTISFIVLLATALTVAAQTGTPEDYNAGNENAQRLEAEKHIETISDSMRIAEAFKALQQMDFILEADRIYFKHGTTVYVPSSTNFVSLSGDRAVIQIASFRGRGPNGIGGIALEGRAQNVKIKVDKKGNSTLTMSVSGAALSATVNVSLPNDSYTASVSVNPNFSSNRITLYGTLLPFGKSDVFKGRTF